MNVADIAASLVRVATIASLDEVKAIMSFGFSKFLRDGFNFNGWYIGYEDTKQFSGDFLSIHGQSQIVTASYGGHVDTILAPFDWSSHTFGNRATYQGLQVALNHLHLSDWFSIARSLMIAWKSAHDFVNFCRFKSFGSDGVVKNRPGFGLAELLQVFVAVVSATSSYWLKGFDLLPGHS